MAKRVKFLFRLIVWGSLGLFYKISAWAGYTCTKCYTSCAANNYLNANGNGTGCHSCAPCPDASGRGGVAASPANNTNGITSCYAVLSPESDEKGTFGWVAHGSTVDGNSCYYSMGNFD